MSKQELKDAIADCSWMPSGEPAKVLLIDVFRGIDKHIPDDSVVVPREVVDTLVGNAYYLLDGEQVCVYCNDTHYHHYKVDHSNDCPIKLIAAQQGDKEDTQC